MLHPRRDRASYVADKIDRLCQERTIQERQGYPRRVRILSGQIARMSTELATLQAAAA